MPALLSGEGFVALTSGWVVVPEKRLRHREPARLARVPAFARGDSYDKDSPEADDCADVPNPQNRANLGIVACERHIHRPARNQHHRDARTRLGRVHHLSQQVLLLARQSKPHVDRAVLALVLNRTVEAEVEEDDVGGLGGAHSRGDLRCVVGVHRASGLDRQLVSEGAQALLEQDVHGRRAMIIAQHVVGQPGAGGQDAEARRERDRQRHPVVSRSRSRSWRRCRCRSW